MSDRTSAFASALGNFARLELLLALIAEDGSVEGIDEGVDDGSVEGIDEGAEDGSDDGL